MNVTLLESMHTLTSIFYSAVTVVIVYSNQINVYQKSRSNKSVIEKKQISYWLEKLHNQGNTTDNQLKSSIAGFEHLLHDDERSPETKGKEQHAKNQSVRIEKDRQRVDELVRKSNRSIITISSTFPWNLFPDTIDVEESRVTFIFRQFLTHQSHSVDIKDISNVFIESGFIFATLQVVSRTFVQNDIKISYLNKTQALKVKGVIEGLRTFENNKIDTSNYEVRDLVEKLSELHIAR